MRRSSHQHSLCKNAFSWKKNDGGFKYCDEVVIGSCERRGLVVGTSSQFVWVVVGDVFGSLDKLFVFQKHYNYRNIKKVVVPVAVAGGRGGGFIR